MTQFILALCGLPASGKSALADAIKKAMNSNIEIVRTDDWRNNSYYKNWKPEREGPVRAAALDKVTELVIQGKSVIHDDTNYYTSMRHELFKIALENRCAFGVIHVTTPLEVALKWNSERPDSRFPNEVIERINARFDLPGRRYLWDNSLIEVDMSINETDVKVAKIVEDIQNLECVKEPEQVLTTSSEFEMLDDETRKCISRFLEDNPSLRGNREVSRIRRAVLNRATQSMMSGNDVCELLLEELSKLL
ncbi:MAG: hypothetical protein AM326_09600 [Candidatus Thorarchaeota archaeon SMTZ-45]|nr:MAG: hypothetical protein AM325_05495 [Candidatus Thorarchaeota archaeon SMTZ1-45]KXH74720.1 MAG: hypothetical protein AM326_09600 [Candidatus Thorarchaeota archaeon SMTZ-45]